MDVLPVCCTYIAGTAEYSLGRGRKKVLSGLHAFFFFFFFYAHSSLSSLFALSRISRKMGVNGLALKGQYHAIFSNTLKIEKTLVG